MFRRTWVTGSRLAGETAKRWRALARSVVRATSSRQGASSGGAPLPVTSHPSRLALSGKLPLKWVVSRSTRSITPRRPRRSTTQSCPGPRRRDCPPVRARLAPKTQPRHATVGINLEPHVRKGRITRDGELVLGMAGEGRARQQLHEREIQRAQRSSAHSGFARQLRPIERAGGGMISAEVGGINGDHANRARDAKPDDAPVVAALRAAPPAGFPPVHPFASVGVLALDEHGTPCR